MKKEELGLEFFADPAAVALGSLVLGIDDREFLANNRFGGFRGPFQAGFSVNGYAEGNSRLALLWRICYAHSFSSLS